MRAFRGSVGQNSVAGYQRHHLLPVSLVQGRNFAFFFAGIREQGVDRFDFHTNGIILPSTERTAIASGLPMHRGPHPRYTEVVACRLSAIERATAWEKAVRVRWLISGLRKALAVSALLTPLNKRDPYNHPELFGELDCEIERIWGATAQH